MDALEILHLDPPHNNYLKLGLSETINDIKLSK